MPAITGSSLGYAGEINEITGKDFWNRLGASKYGVVGADDLKVSVTTGDRMLLVGSGIAWGHNIQDTLQTSLSVQLSSVASGSRWDMIVVRRDVTAGSSIEVVQGTGTKALPSLTSTAASHADQPIALCRVQAGSTTVQEIVDLRCWAGVGGVVVKDKLALNYLAVPGAEVTLDYQTWRYLPDSNGVFGWDVRGSEFRVWNAVTTFADAGPVNLRQSNITFPSGYFTVPPVVQATKQGGSGAKFIPYVRDITVNGCVVGLYTGDGTITSHGTLPVYIRAVQTSPTSSSGTL